MSRELKEVQAKKEVYGDGMSNKTQGKKKLVGGELERVTKAHKE